MTKFPTDLRAFFNRYQYASFDVIVTSYNQRYVGEHRYTVPFNTISASNTYRKLLGKTFEKLFLVEKYFNNLDDEIFINEPTKH